MFNGTPIFMTAFYIVFVLNIDLFYLLFSQNGG